jgi:hypothetical protein
MLPFPTAMMSAAWLAFLHPLTRRRELVEPHVHERFFHAERTRAWVGVALYCIGARWAWP